MWVDKVQFFCTILWWSVSVNIRLTFFNFLVLFIYLSCFMFRSIFYQLFLFLFFVYHNFSFLQIISNKNKISFVRKKHHGPWVSMFKSATVVMIFWNTLGFEQAFLGRKRNGVWVWLLKIKMVYTVCLTSCRIT